MVSSYWLLQGLPPLHRAILPKVLSFLGPMTEKYRALKARLFQANSGKLAQLHQLRFSQIFPGPSPTPLTPFCHCHQQDHPGKISFCKAPVYTKILLVQ